MSRATRAVLLLFVAPVGLLLAAGLSAIPAAAHVVIEGTDEFTAGLLHPIFVLPQMLLIVGLGLLLSQQGMATLRVAAAAVAVTLIAGLAAAGIGLTMPFDIEVLLLGLAVACGLLVALARPLPAFVAALLAAFAGLAVGLDSPPETGGPWTDAVALAGTGMSVCLLLFNIPALASYLNRPWHAIGIRVLGSWISASALMVSALTLLQAGRGS